MLKAKPYLGLQMLFKTHSFNCTNLTTGFLRVRKTKLSVNRIMRKFYYTREKNSHQKLGINPIIQHILLTSQDGTKYFDMGIQKIAWSRIQFWIWCQLSATATLTKFKRFVCMVWNFTVLCAIRQNITSRKHKKTNVDAKKRTGLRVTHLDIITISMQNSRPTRRQVFCKDTPITVA